MSQNRRVSEPAGRNVRVSEPSGSDRVSYSGEKGAISCVRRDKRRTKRRMAQQLCGFGSATVRFGSKTLTSYTTEATSTARAGGSLASVPVPGRARCKASKCVRQTHAQDDPKRQRACADPSGASKCVRRSTRKGCVWIGVNGVPGEGYVRVTEETLPWREGVCCGLAQAL